MKDTFRETTDEHITGRDNSDDGIHNKPPQSLPDVWQAAFAWCPPPSSRMLGARGADGAGEPIHPDTERFQRFRFMAAKERPDKDDRSDGTE